MSDGPMPLVIDLDGTLLRSDLLLETGLAFLRTQPWFFFKPLYWLAQGKPVLKEALAEATELDVTTLPYDPRVLELIRTARSEGRPVVLATASHHSLAVRIAEHLQLFDQVLASDRDCNLSGGHKAERLRELYGEKGFDYAGNAKEDLPVLRAARHAIAVSPTMGLRRHLDTLDNLHQVVDAPSGQLKAWLKALRVHQWLKNLLIFVPLLTAHQIGDVAQLGVACLAFLIFGLCASSVYLLNDLLDLADDRHHATKCRRPFAAGNLSLGQGLWSVLLLWLVAFSAAWLWLSQAFVFVLGIYYLLTLAYSLYFKRIMAVDVLLLALLYTLRIVAGAAALGLPLTFWVLTFSMFMFLSLALVKRYAELLDARQAGLMEKTRGRGYYPDDLEMVSSLGAASGYLSVMVLALYIHDPDTSALYAQPELIWLACPLLLFWITRIWMLTHRGQVHQDPVIFAIRDRCSLWVGALFGLVFWVAA